MTKRQARVRIEVLLYILLIVTATWLRVIKLDWPPLNDAEATNALTALQGMPDASPLWSEVNASPSTSPAYEVLTRLVFQFVGPSDVAARSIPLLFGLALVLVPLFLRRQLGKGRALATAWLLGLSPTLIAASRSASGTTLAALGLMAAVAVVLSPDIKARAIWIAMALGLTLASDSGAVTALIGFGIAAAVARRQTSDSEESNELLAEMTRKWWLIPLVALVIASGFGLYLKGISSLLDSLIAWITGWVTPSGISQFTLWGMLPIYEPLILALGIGGAILAWRRQEARGMAVIAWAVVAIVLVSLYPARQPSDVIWVIIPLALLAGGALAHLVEQWAETRTGVALAGLVGMILIVFTYGYLQLAAYSSGSFIDPQSSGMVLLFALAAIALLVTGILLFGLGWSWGLAWRGASATVFLLLFTVNLSTIYRLALASSAAGGRELWRPQSSTLGMPMLVDTLSNLSTASTGRAEYLEIEVSPDVTPGLMWALRDFGQAFLSDPFRDVSASVVLMPEYATAPGLTGDYVGQVVTVSERWGWTGALPRKLAAWYVRREAPAVGERWLLFVKPAAFGLEDLELQ